MQKKYIFTSESVTEGHPDKICDIIADTILDSALAQDINSKMAVEATIKDDLILIYGEANTTAIIDYQKIALEVIREIGYKEDYQVIVKVNQQSKEINNAVVKGNIIAAGDQGIMFGYACNDNDLFMPMPITLAHKLAYHLTQLRKRNDFLCPDGKTQVSVEYINDKPIRIDTIVISTQHKKSINQQQLKDFIMKELILKVIDNNLIDESTKFFINPSGSFIVGGSFGDSGTTGRKIAVDTYGGMGRIGGGCLSSKDPSKVDRSGAYYCRYVAKNIVANHLADKCEIQVSYTIGKEKPVSIYIDTFGTNKISIDELNRIIDRNFDFSVSNIIKELDLLRPIYKNTSCYGHFGRKNFSWEKIRKLKI